MKPFYEEHKERAFEYIDGIRQVDRLIPALRPDHFKVDEKSIADLLVYTERLSEAINFFNHNNDLEGDWRDFFERDPSFLLAKIVSTDVNHFFEAYKRVKEQLNHLDEPADWILYYSKMYEVTAQLAKVLDGWHHTFQGSLGNSGIKDELRDAITDLDKFLNELQLQSPVFIFNEGLRLRELFEQPFHPDWKLKEEDSPELAENIQKKKEEYAKLSFVQRLDKAKAILDNVFQQFRKTTINLIRIAEGKFEQTLTNRPDHAPQIGLVIAFFKLMDFARQDINTITRRHLDFFYTDILRQNIRKAKPDQVHLYFKLPENTTQFDLPANTLLDAGLDIHDHEIRFRTDKRLSINQVEVAAVKTTYVSSPDLNSTQESKLQFHRNLVYAAPVANSKDGIGEPLDDKVNSWPALGEDQSELDGSERNMLDAEIGLLIAAPILGQREGLRSIKLRFELTDESFKPFIEKVERSAMEQDPRKESYAHYRDVIENAFNISFTSPEGWSPARYRLLSIDKESDPLWEDVRRNATIEVEFTVDRHEPAIDPFNPEVHGYTIAEPWPMIRLHLKSAGNISSYDFLKSLVIRNLTLGVSAKGVRNFSVSSSTGVLDIQQPFQPFGAVPSLGSYFTIKKPETINKYLKSMALLIEWMDLPLYSNGFEGLFESYNPLDNMPSITQKVKHVKNSSFKVKISTLRGSKYFPEYKNRQEVNLFTSQETEDDKICEHKTIDIMVSDWARSTITTEGQTNDSDEFIPIELDNPPEPDDLQNEDMPAQVGVIKVELSSPEIAFGHAIFPKTFAHIAWYNTTSEGMKAPQPYPDQPYAPTIKSLLMDYSMELIGVKNSKLGDGMRLRSIYPFGVVDLDTDQIESKIEMKLIPAIDDRGSLYIGLNGLKPPETVTLFFKLTNPASYQTFQSPPKVSWSYLANNTWKEIKRKSIVEDSTQNLIKTGIVKIEIPREINRNNSILSPDLFWIKANVASGSDVTSRVVSLNTNVVTATRIIIEEDSYQEIRTLPENTINDFVDTIPEVESIHQPYPSFGGDQSESEEEYYIRVSERLNHKRRALTSKDFEKIVLQRFPEIMVAKCIGYIHQDELKIPETNVQMIVLPQLDETSFEGAEIPKVPYETLVSIKNHLSTLVSPFVKIEVGNPDYERVEVVCSVEFHDNSNRGYLVQRLNEDLRRFISPWTFDNKGKLSIGGILSISGIRSFIESRDYIKNVTKFSINHWYDDENRTETNFKTMIDTAIGTPDLRKIERSRDQNEYLIVAKLVFKEMEDHEASMQELSEAIRKEVLSNIDALRSESEELLYVDGKEMIENFINRQTDYISEVEYLEIFDLSEKEDKKTKVELERSNEEVKDSYQVNYIKPSKPQAMLISEAEHQIEVDLGDERPIQLTSIGSMKVGKSFILLDRQPLFRMILRLDKGLQFKRPQDVEEKEDAVNMMYTVTVNPELAT